MTTRYPGGLIRKTPPTITPPVGGEGGSAPGVWTLEQASYYTKQGTWPKPVLPRYLYSWGLNSNGQLGQNNTIYRSSPVQVGSLNNWSTLITGVHPNFSAAIKSDGTLWSWGINSAGELGLGDVINRSSPVQVGALTNWSKISGGGQGYCIAIKTDGTMWSWGNGANGVLGKTDTDISRSSPVQIGALTTWSDAFCGFQVNFALKTDGTLWSWGSAGFGGLGLNGSDNQSSPTQIGALTTWSKISAEAYGGLMIKTDGTLWSWGYNGQGGVGTGDTVTLSSPVQIGALTTWSSLGSGYFQGSAIKTDGTLWAWGGNDTGQLGQNNIANTSSPVQVGTGTNWSSVYLAFKFCLATKTDGTLWTWGKNDNGELGQNDRVYRSSPVQVGSATTWKLIRALRDKSLVTSTA